MVNKKEIVCYNYDISGLIGNARKVIFPKTSEEVEQIIKDNEGDIIPRGAGTNLVGGCVPNNSIIVDMSKMNRVFNFNPVKKTVSVEAGTTLKELNEKLSRVGFEFPIETFNRGISTLGGMIALNIPGFRSMKYGGIRDWIEELEFVNGRGELMRLGKSDLMDVCGMEGITGIITSARLKIIPKKQRSASIFQSDELEEIFSIARRLKLEKEVVMLEFFPPQVSKRLGLPEKYHIIIEFDSKRGKIKGKEYEIVSKFKYRVYDILYSEGYCFSEDPKFFFDKLKEFVLFLESNQIPYFGYLDIGIIHPFFKLDEKEKRQEVVNLIKKMQAKSIKYGIGLNRKNLLDAFEKKMIQRVKLRYDPFLKLNNGKIIDIDFQVRRFPREEAPHLKPLEKKELEEIKPLIGEEKGALEILDELKTPNEKMDEFIEKVELLDKIADNEKPIKQSEDLDLIKKKEEELRINNEIKKRIKDYEDTFKSELINTKRKVVENFALNVGRERPIKSVEEIKQKREKIDTRKIQDIMTNRHKNEDSLNIKEESLYYDSDSKIDINRIMTNNYNKEEIKKNEERNSEKTNESERDVINKIMNNKFGFNNKDKNR